MTEIKLNRLQIKEQLSTDLLKVFALVEKTLMASALMMLVFVFINRISLANGFFGWEVLSGLIGYLAITTKKMYYDGALSELRISSEVKQEILYMAMLSIGYSEKKVNVFLSKKLFSFFFYCKSEAITYTPQRGATVFTGPYDKLLKLSHVCTEST
ncbi:hypothetical protein CD58_22520 [Pseudomonas brassicacearum]|uniref:hypothetical protein n=1 Tax=Pseudomonas brassicacearum TaxID=930166 RepID=UPI00042E8F50|nr:hypothetical protein [Pseudomonas brassicacearum]AHL36933.1 hypothetical protein CD58_22520 [Pseudomonas brassicacearum]